MKSTRPRLHRGGLALPLIAVLVYLSGALAAAVPASPRFCAIPPRGAFTPGPDRDRLVDLHGSVQAAGAAKSRAVDRSNGRYLGPRFLRSRARPIAGRFKVLVLAAEFTDVQGTTNLADLSTLFFQPNTGSMRDYFLENSYGKVDLDGVIVGDPRSRSGFLRLPQTYGYYSGGKFGTGAPPNDVTRMTEDALVAAARANPRLDWRQFDADSDGMIDFLVVYHAGEGAEGTDDPNTLWSLYSSLPLNSITRRNIAGSLDAALEVRRSGELFTAIRDTGGSGAEYTVSANSFVVVGEDFFFSTLAHELGHAMGLPDLYGQNLSHEGPGEWSLMASGTLLPTPSHLDAWSKSQLGWLTPVEIDASASGLPLPQAERNAVAYRVPADPLKPQEYFLLENRVNADYDRESFDASLPNSGLIIYHVDESVESNDNRAHPLLRVEEADGQYNMLSTLISLPFPRSNLGDPFDPWPTWSKAPKSDWFQLAPAFSLYRFFADPEVRADLGLKPPPEETVPARDKDTFGPATRPSTDNYRGESSGVTIRASQPGRQMVVDVTIDRTGGFRGAVRGSLTTEDASPLPAVTVSLVNEAGQQIPLEGGLTGNEFAFLDLPGGTYRLQVSAEGWVPLVRTVDLTAADQSVSLVLLRQPVFAKGWNLASVPLDFEGARAADVFGDPQVKAFAYQGGAYVQNPILRPGMGFWLYEDQEGQHKVGRPGQPVSLTAPAQMALATGWNLLGNPFTLPLDWDVERLGLRTAAGLSTLKAARAAGLASDFGWVYNSATGKYQKLTTTPAAGDTRTLGVWSGFWFHSGRAGALIAPPPVSTAQ